MSHYHGDSHTPDHRYIDPTQHFGGGGREFDAANQAQMAAGVVGHAYVNQQLWETARQGELEEQEQAQRAYLESIHLMEQDRQRREQMAFGLPPYGASPPQGSPPTAPAGPRWTPAEYSEFLRRTDEEARSKPSATDWTHAVNEANETMQTSAVQRSSEPMHAANQRTPEPEPAAAQRAPTSHRYTAKRRMMRFRASRPHL